MKKEYPETLVNGLIFNDRGDILLVKDERWKGKLALPGGHVEIGETLKDALKREISDQLQIDIDVKKMLDFQESLLSPEYRMRKHLLLFSFMCRAKDDAIFLGHRSLTNYVWVRPEDALNMNLDSHSKAAIKKYLEKVKKKSGTVTKGSNIKINIK